MIEQLQKIEPQRDQLGYWIHPAFNHFYEQIAQGADGLTKTQMEQLEKLIGHKISITEIFEQLSEEDAVRLEKGDMDVISEWQPEPPNDKAFLVSIHDTDDGTVACWATPQATNDQLVSVEKAHQEMKRQAFEGYFKNTEIYNRECHLRKADILETWSKHLGGDDQPTHWQPLPQPPKQ